MLETRSTATDQATLPRHRDEPATARPAAPDRPDRDPLAADVAVDALAGLLAHAVVQRTAMLARFPLTIALEFADARDARAQLGDVAYTALARWSPGYLDPILAVADPVRRRLLIRTFAERFAALSSDEVRSLLRRLTTPLGPDAVVALTPAQAAFLLGFADRHLTVVHGVLQAVGGDVGRATTAMGLLNAYLDDPARLAIARGTLEDEGYDIGRAAPIVAYLLRYEGDPRARLVARDELATAGRNVTEAGRAMEELARYNYDRHVRDLAGRRAAEAADAEHGRAVAAAAEARRLDELAAENAAGQEYARHAPKGERPAESRKASPTKLKAIKKWDTTQATALAKADIVRQAALRDAEEAERLAVVAAGAARPGGRDAALVRIDEFVARATVAVGAADAAFIAQASGLDLPVAEALLGVFADHDAAIARPVATWLTRFGADMPTLARARNLATAALRGGLAVPLATQVAELLLTAPLADGPRDTLIAAIAATTDDFADVRTLLETHYPARRDQAASALQAARSHAVPISLLNAFGASAHVFMAAVPADAALLVAWAPWVLKLRAQTGRGVSELCELARDMRVLPEDKAELLVDSCATAIDGLKATDPAAYNALLVAAQGIALDALAAEAHWYWLWRVKLDQPLAGINAINVGMPDVAERTTLAESLTSAPLRAALITAKGAGAPLRWAKILQIVAMAGPGQRADLGNALAAIAGTYAAATDELLELLRSNHVSGVPTTILYAYAQGAPKDFIVWQHGPNTSQDNFRAHENGWWEYLAGVGAGLVASRTINVRQQKLTGTSGGTTDCLHVFDITFTLAAAGAGNVYAELHNHVNTVSKSQTSLHFKGAHKGREISLASSISHDCRDAVRAVPPTRHFAGGYTNRFPGGYTL